MLHHSTESRRLASMKKRRKSEAGFIVTMELLILFAVFAVVFYFALRLAMVQCMSENSESIPMVLDDPFANYDDDRLMNAMQLLAETGARHQVLLFTCREDVVRAAEKVNAAITRL